MKKFNFEVYKGSSQYFLLFDVMFKERSLNKDHYLLDVGITPSSYRRARASEQNVGLTIMKTLTEKFEYKIPTDNLVDELEKFADKVYFNMNYKIYKGFEEDIQYLEKLIDQNYIIFPVLKLILLLLKINERKNIDVILEENLELYSEVARYKVFYTNELSEIFELLNIYFESKNNEDLIIKNYSNGMAYFILSSRSYYKNDYIGCLYFAYKAKDIFEKEGNIKRILYLNHNIMSSLLNVGNYDECYELASRQILILESLDADANDMKAAYKFLTVASLGQKNYNYVIELLKEKESLNLTEIVCLLISKFNLDKNEYTRYLKNEIDYDSFPSNMKNYLKVLDQYLNKRERKLLLKLENPKLMSCMLKILKKL